MTTWKVPPRAKIFEALSAVADGRVRLVGEREAEVVSSERSKTYVVEWSEDHREFSSNDNASYWRGYVGYPIVAVLLTLHILPYEPPFGALLAGIPWKNLNDRHHRECDGAVREAIAGVDVEMQRRLQAYVDGLMAILVGLHLERLSSLRKPPIVR